MKMKKLACVALAGVMTAALAAPTFATTVKPIAETTESSFQVELEGMIYTPTIRVQVTESGSVYVNPTGSVVAGSMAKALDGTTNLDYSFEDLTVVSTPILIRSDTDKNLVVSATATANVPKTSGITLSSTKPTANETEKKVSLYVTGNSTALGTINELKTTPANGSTPASGGLSADNAIGGTASASSDSARLLTAEADGKKAVGTASEAATIGAATQTKDAAGKVTSVVPQYGVVMIAGDVGGKATGWTESDIVNVSVALTFSISND